MKGNDIIEALYAHHLPVPFLSLWIEDCVRNARDYNAGGARYNTQYLQIVGLGTRTNVLAALKFQVFERGTLTMEEVLHALDADFSRPYEITRQILLNKSPRYGEDDDYADSIAKAFVDEVVRMVEGFPPTPVRQASRRVYFLPTTVHAYFGKVTGATPDGPEGRHSCV